MWVSKQRVCQTEKNSSAKAPKRAKLASSGNREERPVQLELEQERLWRAAWGEGKTDHMAHGEVPESIPRVTRSHWTILSRGAK